MASKISALDAIANALANADLLPIVQDDGGGALTTYKVSLLQLATFLASAGIDASDLLDTLGTPAQGQILYRNGTEWVLLSPGTAGQVLQTGGAGADPSWLTLSSANIQTLLDSLGTPAQGQLIYFNGTDWVLLSPGIAGQVLQTGGAGANPSWLTLSSANIQALLDSLGTPAQGQLIYFDGTDWVLLAPGTSGQFLKTMGAGANPVWAAPATGGDASGPASSTDNTLPRFDGTTGKLLQTSGIVVSDNNELYGYRAAVNQQTGTTYTIDTTAPGDFGKVIESSNASAIAVTLPATAPQGFSCTYVQSGAGQITFASTGSGTMVNRQSHTKTAGQNAVVMLYVRSNGSGSNAVWVLGGDTAA